MRRVSLALIAVSAFATIAIVTGASRWRELEHQAIVTADERRSSHRLGASPIVMAYDQWDFRGDPNAYPSCTHVIHAFAFVDQNAEGYLRTDHLDPNYVDTVKGDSERLVLVSLADEESGAPNFHTICGDDETRGVLVESVVSFVADDGYDGVDVDWESLSDGPRHLKLLRELRGKLPSALLTFTVQPGAWYLYELRELAAETDYCILMGYDYGCGADPQGPWVSQGWADVKRDLVALAREYPVERLVLAMPFYFCWDAGQKNSYHDLSLVQQAEVGCAEMESEEPTRYLEKPYTYDGHATYINDHQCLAAKTKAALFGNEIDGQNIGGVGAWQLGQDTDSAELIRSIQSAAGYDQDPPEVHGHRYSEAPTTDIRVIFSEIMYQPTLTPENITVEGSESGSVDWTSCFDPTSLTLTMHPVMDFVLGEIVSVVVSTRVQDLGANGLTTAHEFSFTAGADCNGNGIADDQDMADCDGSPWCSDCNDNGVLDECDVTDGMSSDCNANAVPDECDIADCDPNDPDCQDCNGNGVPDLCDIADCDPNDPACQDCNENRIPDECDISDCDGGPWCGDCNWNAVPDGCDIDDGTSDDGNSNGVPDECEPLPCEMDMLLADDGAPGDRFGTSVALWQNNALVGAYWDDDCGDDSGSVYAFERVEGAWSYMKLNAYDGASEDQFGYAVALDGDRALIGAHLDDDDGENSGSAYVFETIDGVWTPVGKLTAAQYGAKHDYFGYAVALSGDTALIGAHGDDDGPNPYSGSAYIFEETEGDWTLAAKLTAGNDADAYDHFGISVAVCGDTAVVGADRDDGVGQNAGAVYVFERIGGNWTGPIKLTAYDPVPEDRLGISVAVWGDTILAGAHAREGGGSGAAYLFEKVGDAWAQIDKVTPKGDTACDWFGISVALLDDTALVGAFNHTDDDPGCAYLFQKIDGVWTQLARMAASAGVANDGFGRAVALWGDAALVGAYREDHHGIESGSAYVFDLSDCNGNAVCDNLDIANGTSKDQNGNGIPDECEPGEVPADTPANPTDVRPIPPP